MLNVIPDPEAPALALYVPTLLVTFKVKLLSDVPPNAVPGIVIVSPDVYELPGFVIVTVE